MCVLCCVVCCEVVDDCCLGMRFACVPRVYGICVRALCCCLYVCRCVCSVVVLCLRVALCFFELCMSLLLLLL